MSEEDKEKIMEFEHFLQGRYAETDKDVADARLDSISNTLSDINFTLTEIRAILKKILVVQNRSIKPR